MSAVPPDVYTLHAVRLGIQYYSAGRYAAACRSMPVSANLLHHAIEMFLKGILAPVIGVKSVQALRHDLTKQWATLCDHLQNPDAAGFDSVVRELHKFEKIRYPETMIRGGALLAISFPAVGRPQQIVGARVPEYILAVAEVDLLVQFLFQYGNINREAFPELHQEHTAKYLAYQSQAPLA